MACCHASILGGEMYRKLYYFRLKYTFVYDAFIILVFSWDVIILTHVRKNLKRIQLMYFYSFLSIKLSTPNLDLGLIEARERLSYFCMFIYIYIYIYYHTVLLSIWSKFLLLSNRNLEIFNDVGTIILQTMILEQLNWTEKDI